VRGEKEVLSEFRALCSTALTLLDVSDAVFKVRQGEKEDRKDRGGRGWFLVDVVLCSSSPACSWPCSKKK